MDLQFIKNYTNWPLQPSEIKEEDIPKLSHYAAKEANPLYPVPVLMDAKELETFYYQLMATDSRQEGEK